MNDRSGRSGDASRAKLPLQPPIDPSARRILEIALRLFATHGFHATSMRDLAKVLEIQPSALYTSFPSKDHLLAELVRVGHEMHLATLRAALLASGSDPVDQLRAVVHANALVHATYPHLALVVNDELHALPAELAAPGLALRRQSAALVTEILERGVAMKRFAVPDLTVAAAAIGAMSLRIPYWYRAGDGVTSRQLAAAQAELAVRMVEVRP